MPIVEASETYIDLMRSAPHWGFELTLEALTALILYPAIRWVHKRWESRVHKAIDDEHGIVHVEQPSEKQVRILVMEEATYNHLIERFGRDAVREAERYLR